MHEEEILERNPALHVKRPQVPTESTVYGLDREEVGRLMFAAEAARPCEYALVALLALNGLRVSEALGIDIQAIGMQRGHRTVPIMGKGDKPAIIPLAPRTCRAVDLACGERTTGPLILNTHGQRMNPHSAAWVLHKLGRRAGIGHVHCHQLRHTFIGTALDAGVPLRDVQIGARHADPRTTARYDNARKSLDRHPTYIVASYLAGG
jgi:integrase